MVMDIQKKSVITVENVWDIKNLFEDTNFQNAIFRYCDYFRIKQCALRTFSVEEKLVL